MSDFIESVKNMIAHDFSFDAIGELSRSGGCDIKDSGITKKTLEQLIRSSIAHALQQIEGRKTGTMTFEEAMRLVRRNDANVTRPEWGIFRAIKRADDGSLLNWRFDNTEGIGGGEGGPYQPGDGDRAAIDWMLYQTPEENWVELNFFEDD